MKKQYDYVDVNGYTKKYEIIEDLGIKVSVDYSEDIWAERYRPRIVDDLILEKDRIDKIKSYIKAKDISNIMFYSLNGGTGKDSILSVLNNNINNNMKVINCAMHRNVSDVKNKIIPSISKSSLDGTTRWVYLSEIGNMDKKAVDALKSTIEENSHIRFVVTTNSLDNISEPFMTRFSLFDMNTINKEERTELLKKMLIRAMVILRNEGVEFDKNDVKDFVIGNFPSFRKILVGLKDNVVDGKFKIVTVNETDEIKDYLKSINDKSFVEVVKKADVLNVPNFLRYMVVNKVDVVEEKSDLPDVIYELNSLQEAINTHVPFQAISLSTFAMKMIQGDIKFKLD